MKPQRTSPFPRARGRLALLGSLAVGALALAGCGPSSSANPSGSAGGRIAVVASTNVYGDIVGAVGGDKVSVTSIISKPSQDPHSYEVTAQDRVAVSKAQLVVLNGHGYDDFMAKLADQAKLSGGSIVNAVDASGLAAGSGTSPSSSDATSAPSSAPAPSRGDFNEHVWYSTDAMKNVANAVAERLGALDPADAQAFKDRAAQWANRLARVTSKVEAIKAAHRGEGVAVTEPVPLYMLEAAGLENKTPEVFIAAVEAGNDVPPAALKEMQDLISSHGVKMLAFNPQTESPQTAALSRFARDAKVPVAEFTETMPEGSDYVGWMSANADAIATALSSAHA